MDDGNFLYSTAGVANDNDDVMGGVKYSVPTE